MATDSDKPHEKTFQGWRLLGLIGVVVLVLVVASAAVDWWILGPLLERI